MTKRWVVTGSNGYLGNELCLQLNQHGEAVLALARAKRSSRELAQLGISCHSYEDLPEILARGDVLVHCAGKTGATGSWQDFASTNIDWTAGLFEQATQQQAACFVYISSIAALGYKNRQECDVVDESSPPDLCEGELYGRSKLLAEQMLQDRAENSSTRLVILRPGLIYGRRPIVCSQSWFRRGIIVEPLQRMPLVHINSVCDAILRVVMNPNISGVFIIVDDEQPTLHELNSVKLELGLLRYHPWNIGQIGFWIREGVRFIIRRSRSGNHRQYKEHLLSEYRFQTRRLRYSTNKLRTTTGWTPRMDLVGGLKTCGRAPS